MDKTVDSLRNLYVALGGTAADVADLVIIPDLINAISTQVATALSSATELPKVTSSDNGKVLTVVSGKWNKANLPE